MKLLKPILLALTCALLLAGLNFQTRGVIEDNQKYFEQRLLRLMVTDVSDAPEFAETPLGYLVTEQDQPVAEIKRVVTTKGYNGDIALLVAHYTDGKLLAVRVTEHKETPGIGDKIDISVSPWITQFRGRTTDTNFSLAPVGDIDGITGATITSRAVSDAINEVLRQ